MPRPLVVVPAIMPHLRKRPRGTPEDTVVLVRQLAREFDDAQIARILNKQGRRSGLGNPFTRQSVTSLRGEHRTAKSPETTPRILSKAPFTADEAAPVSSG